MQLEFFSQQLYYFTGAPFVGLTYPVNVYIFATNVSDQPLAFAVILN